MQLHDLPPDHGSHLDDETLRGPAAPKQGRGRWVAVGVAALLVLATAAALFWFRASPVDTGDGDLAPSAPPPVASVEEEEPSGPPVSAADADDAARTVFAPLSAEPEWAAWLTEKDLLRRLVGAVSALADGESPRANVPFLAPKTPFAVLESDDGTVVVDPASWERYEPLGRVIRALDVGQAFEAFRSVSPLLEQLHREGARPGDRFPKALERGLDRILALPLPEADAALLPAPSGAAWIYADPQLEALPAAEKHLLRLGPTILAELKEKASQLKAALDAQ